MKALNQTPVIVRVAGITMALAALVIALAVAVVNVNVTQAQGLGPPIGGDLNKINYTPPFPCNGDELVSTNAAETIDNEHYAVFDAFWDYNHNRLSMNFCPPGAEHETEEDEETGETVIVTTREQSRIDIRKTVLSITDASRKDVVRGTSPDDDEISRDIYTFLPASSTKAWWLQEDDDRYLAMGFSTGLLKEEHWVTPSGETAPVQFEFEAIELPTCLDASQEAHFYVFETGSPTAKWDSSNTDTNDLTMNADEYKHFNWVFTCPGIYKVQVHFKAHPSATGRADLGIDDLDKTITSEAQLYTFHVGPEDDLGVSVTPTTQDVAATSTSASFTVTAANGGPDDADDAEVQIYLPEGLEYVADSSHTGVTHNNGVIVWDLGQLAPTTSTTTPTLNFSTSIDRTKATGTVTVRAEIRNVARQDLDPNSANNVSFAAVRLSSAHVHAPIFTVKREIEEFASSYERVGDPVAAFSPELRTLTYSLSGRGSGKFEVLDNGQIVVANNVELEYEKQWSYWLTLTASDGTNSDAILVKIRVINVLGPKVRFWTRYTDTLDPPPDPTRPRAERRDLVLHAKLHDLPAGVTLGGICDWEWADGDTDTACSASFLYIEPPGSSVPTTYKLTVPKSDGSLAVAGAYTINWRP